MEWAILEKVGIAGVALGGFWVIYQIFIIFMNQWGASTEALNRNTEGFEKLSEVFEQSTEREMEFLKEMVIISQDTNAKVSDLHRELLEKTKKKG